MSERIDDKSADRQLLKPRPKKPEGPRTIADIAIDVWCAWDPPAAAARPYLLAMASLHDITDWHHNDTAASVVQGFLGNAQGWRGETARRLKAELRALLEGQL